MLLFLFLIIDLYFLIPTTIAKIFNPIEKILNPIVMPRKKTEIEIHPAIAEAKIRKCLT